MRPAEGAFPWGPMVVTALASGVVAAAATCLLLPAAAAQPAPRGSLRSSSSDDVDVTKDAATPGARRPAQAQAQRSSLPREPQRLSGGDDGGALAGAALAGPPEAATPQRAGLSHGDGDNGGDGGGDAAFAARRHGGAPGTQLPGLPANCSPINMRKRRDPYDPSPRAGWVRLTRPFKGGRGWQASRAPRSPCMRSCRHAARHLPQL